MRPGEAIRSRNALSFIAIFAAYLWADLLIVRHLRSGIALTLVGAFWSVAWIMTLPRLQVWGFDLTALIRFWLLVAVFGGTSAFLVQKYYDEQNYRLSLPSGLPVPSDGKTRPGWCPPPFWCD
jgi:hypothetical protein